jgi:hypothetical protein
MSNPQQPELARSRKTPAQDQDAVSAVVDGQRHPGAGPTGGDVPPENQPGHHPEEEQDKPNLNAFAEKLGTMEPAERTGLEDDARAPLASGGVPQALRSNKAYAGGLIGAAVVVVALVFRGGRRRRRRSRSERARRG